VVVGRGAAAEEAEFGFGGDLVARPGRDEDGISGGDIAGFAVDLHQGGAFEKEIKFLAELVVVAFGGLARSHGGLGQTLLFDGCVGAVEDAADGGPVFGREGALISDWLHYHGPKICDFSRDAPL